MANPSNRDGYPIEGQIDHRSREALEVRNFKSKSAPISLIKIGNYQIRSRNESHLTAKWYYTSKQLNWEISENGLKKKIEIDWSNISALRVGYSSNSPFLGIELYRRPRFYREAEGCTRTRTSWNRCSDFTAGQASTFRIHLLEFPRDILVRRMEPLFTLDHRLRDSTQRPFPSLGSPFFRGYIAGARQAPALPQPQIRPLMLQNDQIPPGHSSVPSVSSNSNLMDSTSTGPQSANDGNPQPSLSSPSSRPMHRLELIMGPSASRRRGMIFNMDLGRGHSTERGEQVHIRQVRIGHSAQNATASSNDPDNTRHGREGHHQASSSNSHLDPAPGPPSS